MFTDKEAKKQEIKKQRRSREAVLSLLLASCLFASLSALTITQEACGETLSLNSYYPSPFGIYDRLRLVPRAADPVCVPGTLFVKEPAVPRYCGAAGWIDLSLGPGGGVWTKTAAGVYLTDTDPAVFVGIGTSDPEFKLTLDQDGGILAKGRLGGGPSLPALSAGAYLIWYPKKAAFRAGSVTGAQWNDVNIGNYSTVTGGLDNTADGNYAVVGGGQNNTASFATVGGGQNNTTSPPASSGVVIGGGRNNTTYHNAIVIGGGVGNASSAHLSVIAGGAQNTAIMGTSLDNSVIAGGNNNTVSSQDSTVAGGMQNMAGMGGTVGGGTYNNAQGYYSTIAGGGVNVLYPNTICTTCSLSTIAGGWDNTVNIGGGYSTISGGVHNTTNNLKTTISGGYLNSASGEISSISGGSGNRADGYASVIPGGSNKIANGDYSWAGGTSMLLDTAADNTFVWGHSSAFSLISVPNAFIIFPTTAAGKAGIGTANPQAKLHVNGNIKIGLPAPVGGSPLYYDRPPGTREIGYDAAELFETGEPVEPGSVLVMEASADKKYVLSRSAYDTKVVGVVSGAPAIVFEGSELKIAPAPGEYNGAVKSPVALAGRVLCHVSTENGAIEPGDLLTTSSTPGHAMKATDRTKAFGAVVGKALERFTGGPRGETTGKILIFL